MSKNRYLIGALAIGDASTDAAAAQFAAARAQQSAQSGGSGTSWATIAGLTLTVIVGAAALPKLLKWVG